MLNATGELLITMYCSHRSRWVVFSVLLIVGCQGVDNTTFDTANGTRNSTRDCLDTTSEVETVIGHFEEKFSPTTAPGKTFDAREGQVCRIIPELKRKNN